MCAIFGVGFLKNHSFRNNNAFHQFLNNLMCFSEARGEEATGLAVIQDKRVVTIKHNVPAAKFVELNKVKRVMKHYCDVSKVDGPDRLKIVLGHCRRVSRGPAIDNANNHPIVTKKVIGVYNGLIGNCEALFDNFKGVPYIERKGKVDSEIVFQLVDYYSNVKGPDTKTGIQEATAKLQGDFACGMVNKRDSDVLWLFKAEKPTAVVYYPKAGIIVFSSVLEHILNAADRLDVHLRGNFGPYKVIEYPKRSGMGINVMTKKANRFPLKDFVSTERKPAKSNESIFGIS